MAAGTVLILSSEVPIPEVRIRDAVAGGPGYTLWAKRV